MNGSRSEVVERALAYPFAVPDSSFAVRAGRSVPLAEAGVDRARRRALVAYGSNASPAVLARKLAADADPAPVLRAALPGLDAVYSAHVAAYGSVPATLVRSEGTVLPAFVAFLTERQLELISPTEPNYRLVSTSGLSCRLEDGERIEGAALYLSRHGCLLAGGAPLAVAEIAAEGRRLAAATQREALERVRALVAPRLSLAEFVADCVERGRPVARELAAAGAVSLPAEGRGRPGWGDAPA